MKSFIKKHPVLTLIILSPMLAELASGSTPVFRFFSPWGIILGLGFYGLGALLIREITAYKKLGYVSVLLLGAAFGVLEEGILLKSWFDPHWPGATILVKSLEVGGLIPFMPLMLIPYHAVLSITVPIMLVQSATGSKDAWVSKKRLGLVILFFILSGIIFSAGLGSKVQIQGWHFILTLILFGTFSILGLRKIKDYTQNAQIKFSKLLILGVLFLPLLAIIFWLFSGIHLHWFVILGTALLMYWIYTKTFLQINSSVFSEKQYFAIALSFAAGTIPFSAIIALQQPVKFLNVLFALILTLILIRVYKKFSST